MRLKKADTYSYAQYWRSVDIALNSAKKIYLSPDGVYNQININSLQTGEGRYALDKRAYINITSLRNLAGKTASSTRRNKTAILFGNPQYGSAAIAPLPGTGKEVIAIKGILSKFGYTARVEEGKNASEHKIKSVAHEGILHVATHGFFVADPKQSHNSVFSVPLYNINENVLLRSGLLLAGAGHQQVKVSDLSVSDNGVLTSYEVMNLDLQETDLVVLSACETGLGDVMSGEGVFGLQRAFMIAGASSVIMSLWKVDDEATQKLMVQFYKNWLQTGDMEKSFRSAQQEVRSAFNHPYYWGSFVLLQH